MESVFLFAVGMRTHWLCPTGTRLCRCRDGALWQERESPEEQGRVTSRVSFCVSLFKVRVVCSSLNPLGDVMR